MNDNTNNTLRCEITDIKKFVTEKKYNLVGDVLEFGTFTGRSTQTLASMFPDKKIFTIDHFLGLEETKKGVPKSSDWIKDAFSIYNPLYKDISNVPKSIDEVRERFSSHPNITMIIEDVHKLNHPSEYGITQVAICNIDVDIYEPTVSSLEFLSKCQWSEVFIRFDDWHGNDPDYDQHERLAFHEWVEKYKYEYIITHGGYIGGAFVKR